MNEPFGQKATVATIGGAKESLIFGVRYDVRYGTDDAVLRGALLGERAANGDLVFYVTTDSTKERSSRFRVRPSTIDAITPHADTFGVPDGEAATAYLARLETVLGGAYARWIETDEGQRILRAAADEDRRGRTGKVSRRKGGPALVGEILSDLDDAGAFPRYIGEEAEPVAPEVLERNLKAIADSPDVREFFVPAPKPTRVSRTGKAKLVAAGVENPPDELPAGDVVRIPAKGRPYAERNQVWRCGSCKRRTRAPFCENGHARVEAPAGKRRDDR